MEVEIQRHAFLTSALEGCEGQLNVSAALPRCPLDRRLGGSQSQSGRGGEEKTSSSHLELNPRTPIV
jgi:hypothetical protein